MTGTGYATAGFTKVLLKNLFLFIMFIGGCNASTTCVIKVSFQVLYAAKAQFGNLANPEFSFRITTATRSPTTLKVRSRFSLFGKYLAVRTGLALLA